MKIIPLIFIILTCCACTETSIVNPPGPSPSEDVPFSEIKFGASEGSTQYGHSSSLTVTSDRKVSKSSGSTTGGCTGSLDLTDSQFGDIVNLVKASGLENFDPADCRPDPEMSGYVGEVSYFTYVTAEGVKKRFNSYKICDSLNRDELRNLQTRIISIADEIEVECTETEN